MWRTLRQARKHANLFVKASLFVSSGIVPLSNILQHHEEPEDDPQSEQVMWPLAHSQRPFSRWTDVCCNNVLRCFCRRWLRIWTTGLGDTV